MPRFSVPVTIVKDYVVEAETADAAFELVKAAVDAKDEEWSADVPDIFAAAEMTDDYTSTTGDNINLKEA